ncbi:MAG: class I SAM-dependent methyltransferase [Phycisphaerales bacterium]
MPTNQITVPNSQIRPPEDFFLPAGYIQQDAAHSRDKGLGDGEYWTDERIESSRVYQFHVYRWAAELIQARSLASVLDVGSGTGIKLRDHITPVCNDIEGFDQPAGVRAAQRLETPGVHTAVDLEQPDIQPHRTFDLIISADVIEHMLDPDPMLELIKSFCDEQTLVLLSTPDRARLHGRDCMASTKPEHVREWAADEFVAYLKDRGFEIEAQHFFPADDTPIETNADQEAAFKLANASLSPHRCHTVLCKPKRG